MVRELLWDAIVQQDLIYNNGIKKYSYICRMFKKKNVRLTLKMIANEVIALDSLDDCAVDILVREHYA